MMPALLFLAWLRADETRTTLFPAPLAYSETCQAVLGSLKRVQEHCSPVSVKVTHRP